VSPVDDDGELYWSCNGQILAVENDVSSDFHLVDVQTGTTSRIEVPDDLPGTPESYAISGWTPEGEVLMHGTTQERRRSFIYSVDLDSGTWTERASFSERVYDAQPVALSTARPHTTSHLVVLKPVDDDGFEDLWLLDVKNGAMSRLTDDKGSKSEVVPYIPPCP